MSKTQNKIDAENNGTPRRSNTPIQIKNIEKKKPCLKLDDI